jgi:ABC-2 type transport system ATP-binding protein
VELGDAGLLVRTSDFGHFTRRMPEIARGANIRLLELTPTDDSLESVFAYLVGR